MIVIRVAFANNMTSALNALFGSKLTQKEADYVIFAHVTLSNIHSKDALHIHDTFFNYSLSNLYLKWLRLILKST